MAAHHEGMMLGLSQSFAMPAFIFAVLVFFAGMLIGPAWMFMASDWRDRFAAYLMTAFPHLVAIHFHNHEMLAIVWLANAISIAVSLYAIWRKS